GIAQALIGVVGATGVAPGLDVGGGASIFNILSGAALSYLGFKGTPSQQKTGGLGIGVVNALVGVLGIMGIREIAGIPMTAGTVGTIVNLAVGAWGILAGITAKKAAHA
ncbi:MAG: hypothetical protein ACRD3V_05935, partial [Vicinamibacteria bacterium]